MAGSRFRCYHKHGNTKTSRHVNARVVPSEGSASGAKLTASSSNGGLFDLSLLRR